MNAEPASHADDVDPLVGRDVAAFRLGAMIGRGAMGRVYTAEHGVLGRRVAIKVLEPQFVADQAAVQRFVEEARAVNGIRHPNIIDITDFGDLDGRPYFVMELLDGETLGARLETWGHLEPAAAIRICVQVASALMAAHDKGVIHRDLKPDNIFLCNHPDYPDHVKVLDFGVAKLTRGATAGQSTQAGMLLGTPLYMSPEQSLGDAIDQRSDVYALGVVLFEAITGVSPFDRPSLAEILVAHVHDAPPAPRALNPAISEALEHVVLRALAKNPGARFDDMRQMRAALVACQCEVPRLARPATAVAAEIAVVARPAPVAPVPRPATAVAAEIAVVARPAPVAPVPRQAAEIAVVARPAPVAPVPRQATAVAAEIAVAKPAPLASVPSSTLAAPIAPVPPSTLAAPIAPVPSSALDAPVTSVVRATLGAPAPSTLLSPPAAPSYPPGLGAVIAETLRDIILRRIASNRLVLPTLPKATRGALKALNDPEASLARIAEALEQDLLVAPQLLRVATSVAYRAAVVPSTVQQAVVRIGVTRLRTLLFELWIRRVFASPRQAFAKAFRGMWQHSFVVAMLARRICEQLGNPIDPEAVHLGGLLHDVGKPLIGVMLFEAEKHIGAKFRVDLDTWIDIVEKSHREVAVALAAKWQLSPELQHVIAGSSAYHDEPERLATNIVCFANAVAEHAGHTVGPIDALRVEALVAEGAERLGLDWRFVYDLRTSIQELVDSEEC